MADEQLTEVQREKLRKAVESRGLAAVAEELGLARGTVANLIGGVPVQKGSIMVARSNIAKVKA